MSLTPSFGQKPGAETTRILVVDDSALMRKLISEILAQAPGMEVIATARNGVDALEKVRSFQPDVITLDVEMPEMNGIEFLDALMPERPTPVVMVSSLTAEGAETTLECLQRGAVDFVTKPSGAISLDIAKRETDIVEKVRAASKARVRAPSMSRAPASRTGPPSETKAASVVPSAPAAPRELLVGGAPGKEGGVSAPTAPSRMDSRTVVVAIASSTGGPAALQEILPFLPAGLNAAYLLVQHLPAGFTRSLAARLDHLSAITVREAQEGDTLERDLALLAPGGRHLTLDSRSRVSLNEEPPLWGVRPAADIMMRSVAAQFGRRVIGVVLTGMGRDGALGAKAVRAAGGVCLAQNEETCVVYGMPRAAVEAEAVDQVVPITRMAEVIAERVRALAQESSARSAA